MLTTGSKWVCSSCIQMCARTQATLSPHTYLRILTAQTSLPGKYFPTISDIWITVHNQYVRKKQSEKGCRFTEGNILNAPTWKTSCNLCHSLCSTSHMVHDLATQTVVLQLRLYVWYEFVAVDMISVILNSGSHVKEVDLRRTRILSKEIVSLLLF